MPLHDLSNRDPEPYFPGYEINYTQITSPVSITSTTESAGTTILSPGAVTFDGGPVLVEFFGVLKPSTVSGSSYVISLFESSTQITELGSWVNPSGANNICAVTWKYRFTPSAGSHTYTVTGSVSSTTGTPAVNGGAGGTAANPPAYVRFSKV